VDAFLLGLSLGLAAGLSPGPLLFLVLREATQKGPKAGVLAALAPLLTDAPVVAAAWLLAARLSPEFLRWVGVFGGLWLFYTGVRGLFAPPKKTPAPAAASLKAGVLANLANPHMYLFWFSVGTPILADLGTRAVFFLLGFYLTLVGSKALLALLAGRLRLSALGKLADLLLALVGVWLILRSAAP